MIIVTTEQIQGERIAKILGLVMGESAGADPFRAREALESMSKEAEKMGANAIIGVRFLYNVLAGGPGMDLEYTQTNFMAYGTAVVVE